MSRTRGDGQRFPATAGSMTPEQTLKHSPATPTTGSMPSSPELPAAAPTQTSAPAWLGGSALGQAITAGAFGSLIVAWVAIGASLASAVGGAAAMCVAVPVIGWFFGLPLVLGFGMVAAAFWFAVLVI